MPDVHSGKGCTIGTTMTITDKAVPNLVGVDIGCGMYTVKLGNIVIDFDKMDEACHIIPSGFNIWESVKWPFDLTELRCYRELSRTGRLNKSLGTLGGGNHFIEIDISEAGTKYLVVHSGSRNLGNQVAQYYQRLAIDLNHGKEEYFVKRDQIIEGEWVHGPSLRVRVTPEPYSGAGPGLKGCGHCPEIRGWGQCPEIRGYGHCPGLRGQGHYTQIRGWGHCPEIKG